MSKEIGLKEAIEFTINRIVKQLKLLRIEHSKLISKNKFSKLRKIK